MDDGADVYRVVQEATLPRGSALARKLTEVMLEVEGIAKNKENTSQHYKFASEEGFLRAVRGPLAKRGVLMLPTFARIDDIHRGETKSGGSMTTITGTFSYLFVDAETGERLEAQVLASGQDSGDKHAYKAMTGALKYAVKQSLLLPTGDDPEYEGATPTRAPAKAKPAGPPPMDRVAFEGSLMLLGIDVAKARELVGLDEGALWSSKFPTLEAAYAAVQRAAVAAQPELLQ